VIAVAPRGSAIARLLDETQAGLSAPQNDTEGIASIIETFFMRWQGGEEILHSRHDEVQKYERRAAAHQLAHILHSVTS
jgi:hypothetical protein